MGREHSAIAELPPETEQAPDFPAVSESAETTAEGHLSEICIRKLHDLAVLSLAESYENDAHGGAHRATAETLRRELAAIVESESHAPEDTGALLDEATDVFLTRVVSLLEQNTPPPGLEDVDLYDVEGSMYQYWFDLHDSLLFDISADRLMRLAEHASKHQHTDFLRSAFVEQSLISFGHASGEELARYDTYLDSLSVPQALDTLHLFGQFQRILFDEELASDIGYQPFRATIQRIIQAHPSMIVRLRAQRLERAFLLDDRLEALDDTPQPQYPRGKGQWHRIEEVFPDLFPDQNAPTDAPLTETQSVFLRQLETMGIRQRGEDIDLCASNAASVINRDDLPYTIAWLDTTGTVQTSTYDQLVENTNLNPFAGQPNGELALLLRHMHEPALRRDLETDLGIRLTDIPLRSQIQLLRFLADQDASGYKRIRSALHHNPDAATDIANAFLAFAEKPELGDSVLHVAELVTNKVDAVKLFHAYAQFTQDADSLADWAMEVRDHYLSGAPIERTETLRHLLSRANTIMHNAETQLPSATTPEQQSACVERITRDLEREDTALRRSLDAFEKIVEEMTMVQTTKAREGATDTAVNNAAAQHRKRLERALHELVLGEQRYALPQEFYQNIWNDCADMKPEVLPQERPMYFPVGISRDLPHWQEVWKGTREAVKPVDLYAWLFWLQNQGKPVELIIADEPQAENFLRQYPERLGTTPAEQRSSALAFARRIGDAEQSMYQEVIKTFDLTNITVRRFAEFRKDESFARYKAVCSRLADHPMWKDAFLAMVKDSVAKNASNAERRAAVTYAVEELALTLSTRGTKISHEGEATYDAIAAALWNVEDYARKHGLQLEDLLTSEKLTPAFNAVLVALQDRCNTGKSRAAKGGPLFTYLEQFRQTLQRIPKTAGVPKEAGISARNVTFAFACPETSSQGFGWRGKGTAGEESVIQPKEPYSTYFPTALSTAFLESDQVVALPNGEIAGKILALPKEQQARYAQEVLRPLLTHFFRVMEKQPKAYRYRLGRDYVDMAFLRKTCAEATTLHELLEFVQQYIVVPASREHPTSIII